MRTAFFKNLKLDSSCRRFTTPPANHCPESRTPSKAIGERLMGVLSGWHFTLDALTRSQIPDNNSEISHLLSLNAIPLKTDSVHFSLRPPLKRISYFLILSSSRQRAVAHCTCPPQRSCIPLTGSTVGPSNPSLQATVEGCSSSSASSVTSDQNLTIMQFR